MILDHDLEDAKINLVSERDFHPVKFFKEVLCQPRKSLCGVSEILAFLADPNISEEEVDYTLVSNTAKIFLSLEDFIKLCTP